MPMKRVWSGVDEARKCLGVSSLASSVSDVAVDSVMLMHLIGLGKGSKDNVAAQRVR